MKTNASSRCRARIRVGMLALAVATVALLELGLGGSLAARIGQTTARQTAEPQAPNVELSDFMIAAR